MTILSRAGRPLLSGLILAAATLSTTLSADAAHAQQAAQAFDIPAGSLGSAISRLGRTARVVIAYDPSLLRGKRTAGLRGTFSVGEALDGLLAGGDVHAVADGRGGFRLVAKPQATRATPHLNPTAATTGGVDNTDIIVMGSAYRDNVATGGARIAAPIRDLPITITSLNKQLIDDRQIRNIRELADNVAGVQSRSSGAANFSLDFTVRGLQFAGIAYNGFRTDGGVGRDQQNVERVEFLKGPASVLYGASGALSGLVNVVTKTPQKDAFLTIDGTGGQIGYARAAVDANAPITDTLQVRVNAATQIADSISSFTGVHDKTVTPVVAWSPLPGLKLLAEYTHFEGSQPPRLTTGRTNYPRLLALPTHFKLGDYGSYNNSNANTYHGEASYEIAPGLTIREGIFRNRGSEDALEIPGYTKELAADGHTLLRSQDSGSGSSRDFSTQTEIRWSFQLGPTHHKLLIGFEHANNQYNYVGEKSQPFPSLDLDNPVYGYAVQPRIFDNEGGGTTIANAPYIQDFMEIGAHWKVLAGVRYDRTKAIGHECYVQGCGKSADPAARNESSTKVNAVSPRVGLTWEPTDRTAVYASWSKSFVPNAVLDKDNNILPSERGTQYEIGLRQDLLADHKLAVTLSAYDLRRQNIIEEDPFNLGSYIAVGEQHVQGIEAELSGKPTPWIDLIGAYSYIHGVVSKSETATTGIPEGERLPEAPHHSASLFSKVTLVPLGLPDTSVGVGIYYTGNRPTRDSFYPADPSFTRYPSTTRIDISFYQVVSSHLRLQANITNLFNTRIYEPVNQGSFIAQPFTATAGFRVTL